jgi:hypothetical protein
MQRFPGLPLQLFPPMEDLALPIVFWNVHPIKEKAASFAKKASSRVSNILRAML